MSVSPNPKGWPSLSQDVSSVKSTSFFTEISPLPDKRTKQLGIPPRDPAKNRTQRKLYEASFSYQKNSFQKVLLVGQMFGLAAKWLSWSPSSAPNSGLPRRQGWQLLSWVPAASVGDLWVPGSGFSPGRCGPYTCIRLRVPSLCLSYTQFSHPLPENFSLTNVWMFSKQTPKVCPFKLAVMQEKHSFPTPTHPRLCKAS